MLFGFINAHAVGTDYGVTVNNTATLNYQVGGLAQTAEASNQDSFVVDRKVDMIVATTDAANIVVVPNDNIANENKPLTFTVRNDTNGQQTFVLTAAQMATGSATLDVGETDSVDFATDVKICVDATCSAGSIANTAITFNEDETKTYYVFADIPSTAVDGERGSIALVATATNDGATTPMTSSAGNADNQGAVDIVFAEAAGDAAGDAAFDGKHSDLSTFEVASATVDVTKISCVPDDNIVGDADNTDDKRIPGATLRFAIDVNNTGTASATNASLTDALPAEVVFVSAEIRDAACNCLTPAGTVIAADTVTNAGQNVTANFGTISAGTHECAYIETTIQ